MTTDDVLAALSTHLKNMPTYGLNAINPATGNPLVHLDHM